MMKFTWSTNDKNGQASVWYHAIFFTFLSLVAFLSVLLSPSLAKAIGYQDIKKMVSQNHVPWTEITQAVVPDFKKFILSDKRVTTSELGGFSSDFFLNPYSYDEDNVRTMEDAVPLEGCGIQSGYHSNLSSRSINFLIENALLNQESILTNYHHLANVVLHVGGALNYYGVPRTGWQDLLDSYEKGMLKKSKLPVDVFHRESIYALSHLADNLTKRKLIEKQFAALHGCGGGLFSFHIRIDPPSDRIQIISKIMLDHCREARRPCLYKESLTDDEIADLSGVYYYRLEGTERNFRRIDVNHFLRGKLRRLHEAVTSGNLDGLSSNGDICFKGGRHGSC